MSEPKPSVGKVGGVDKPCAMARRAISITAPRYTPGGVMTESTSNGATPQVIANDTNKASLPVKRLERPAGKLARAGLRGGGDGDTASLPDPPLLRRSGFRQQLRPGVGLTRRSGGRGCEPREERHGTGDGATDPAAWLCCV
jgi:hypothetical protein